MKLKCIGGPTNNEYWDTYDDKPRIGEYVRTYKPPPLVSYPFDTAPLTVTVNYNMYVVERVCYHKDNKIIEWLYLRYENLDRDKIIIDLFDIAFK